MVENILFLNKEITLPMILKQIEQEGKNLQWSILSLSVMGDLGEDKPVPEFQKRIMEAPEGYLLSWNELCEMSHKFLIVINCVLIGCKDKQTIINLVEKYSDEKYKDSGGLFQECEIAVEIDDGDFLNIYAKTPKIVERVVKRFGPLPVGVYRPLENGG